jgi:hypothetical protein
MRDPKKITQEKLKDRRDYRNALINRREAIDAKIQKIEEEIRKLTGK